MSERPAPTDDDDATSTDPAVSNPARFGAEPGEIEMLGKGTTRSLATPEEEADNAEHDKLIAAAREQ